MELSAARGGGRGQQNAERGETPNVSVFKSLQSQSSRVSKDFENMTSLSASQMKQRWHGGYTGPLAEPSRSRQSTLSYSNTTAARSLRQTSRAYESHNLVGKAAAKAQRREHQTAFDNVYSNGQGRGGYDARAARPPPHASGWFPGESKYQRSRDTPMARGATGCCTEARHHDQTQC